MSWIATTTEKTSSRRAGLLISQAIGSVVKLIGGYAVNQAQALSAFSIPLELNLSTAAVRNHYVVGVLKTFKTLLEFPSWL